MEYRTLGRWAGRAEDSADDKQDSPLVTDRPDFTEASSTVGLGTIQLESGYTFFHDEADGVSERLHSYPETLLRVGILAEWLEMRAAWNYGTLIEGTRGESGAEDLYLGLKLALSLQEGFLPEMAIVPQLTVPTGSDLLSANDVLLGCNWLYGWDITEFISMAGSTQFNRVVDVTGTRYTEWAQSWTIGYSLLENVGAYTEWFALMPHEADEARPEYYFNGGFTIQFCPDVQWDVRAGVGLNEFASDLFVGTGLSLRFN